MHAHPPTHPLSSSYTSASRNFANLVGVLEPLLDMAASPPSSGALDEEEAEVEVDERIERLMEGEWRGRLRFRAARAIQSLASKGGQRQARAPPITRT